MKARSVALFAFAVAGLNSIAGAAPPRILHQTDNATIVRLGADGSRVLWLEVGSEESKKELFSFDLANGRQENVDGGKRPFGPSVSQGWVLFGAGNLATKTDVVLHDLQRAKTWRLEKKIPWIVEPSLQLVGGRLRAVWETAKDIDGHELKVLLFEGDSSGKGETRVVAEGPILLKDQIPVELHGNVRNEYPEIDGDTLAFQNDEFGSPNIYALSVVAGGASRLSPSSGVQERPHVRGQFVAWEESEKGFAVSESSDVYLHDLQSSETKRINAKPGFHYQVRVHDRFVVYGAKRADAPNTPSVRIYDLQKGQELNEGKCFPGSILDYAPTEGGLFFAQRLSTGASRLLYASWEQILSGCP
ncbi:MAG: hypothetical protein IT285_16020 [Bdellovibrionales bacterium]|nr:hypothetical protein [Bdellovibrionales bacterium]